MKVPLLDLRAQMEAILPEVRAAIEEVLASGRYVLGPKVEELEARIAEYVGVAQGVAVSSGTDALLAALMALDVGPSDVVVTTPYTFFATAGAVARLGATPAFVDIDPETYNLDPAALAAWFDANAETRKRVKAVLPVHLYGQAADMDAILDVAQRHGVPVVEDAAQAFGTRYPTASGARRAGAMGAMGCLSFYPSKNLGAVGEGGMVVTNDATLAHRLRILRNHGMDPAYHHAVIGGNFRFDPIQAAVLLVKLPYVESWNTRRRENAAYYDAHLNVGGIKTPALRYPRDCHIYNQYVISVPERRDDLQAFLAGRGIGSEVYYPLPLHLQGCFRRLGHARGAFPNSEYAAEHTLALPVYPELTRPMQDFVIEAIRAFYA